MAHTIVDDRPYQGDGVLILKGSEEGHPVYCFLTGSARVIAVQGKPDVRIRERMDGTICPVPEGAPLGTRTSWSSTLEKNWSAGSIRPKEPLNANPFPVKRAIFQPDGPLLCLVHPLPSLFYVALRKAV